MLHHTRFVTVAHLLRFQNVLTNFEVKNLGVFVLS